LEWFGKNKLAIPSVRNCLGVNELGNSSVEIVFEIDKLDILKMAKRGDKTKDMRTVYIEDDPVYVRQAKVAGIDQVYTFDYAYARDLEPEDNLMMVEAPAEGGLLQIAEHEGFKV